jgi:hypothetical protein
MRSLSNCNLIEKYFNIPMMKINKRIFLPLLIVVCFSLFPPLHYSEQGPGNSPAFSKSGTCLSNVRRLPSDSALFRDALIQTGTQAALFAKHATSGNNNLSNKTRLQLLLFSFLASECPKNNVTQYFSQHAISRLLPEFSLFASDNSPPFYSLTQA